MGARMPAHPDQREPHGWLLAGHDLRQVPNAIRSTRGCKSRKPVIPQVIPRLTPGWLMR
jgi:hypothetical protein